MHFSAVVIVCNDDVELTSTDYASRDRIDYRFCKTPASTARTEAAFSGAESDTTSASV